MQMHAIVLFSEGIGVGQNELAFGGGNGMVMSS